MYQLEKKKRTGYYIVFGVIVFAFISLVLRMGLNGPATTIQQDLVKAANQINSSAPIVVDSTTRLDRVNALPGDIFQYNFTITTLESHQIDTNLLKQTGRESMIAKLKNNPQAAIFKDNQVELQAVYVDSNGKKIVTFSVLPNEY